MRTNSSCWIWKIASRKHQAAIETTTPMTATTTSRPMYALLRIVASACSADSSGGLAGSGITVRLARASDVHHAVRMNRGLPSVTLVAHVSDLGVRCARVDGLLFIDSRG